MWLMTRILTIQWPMVSVAIGICMGVSECGTQVLMFIPAMGIVAVIMEATEVATMVVITVVMVVMVVMVGIDEVGGGLFMRLSTPYLVLG